MNPYVILGAVVALALSGLGGYYKGYQHASTACELRVLKMVQESEAAQDAEARKTAEAAQRLEVANAKARVLYRTITKTVDHVVERPVYRNECFDVDGLRVANEALTGASADTSEPNGAVPEPNATR